MYYSYAGFATPSSPAGNAGLSLPDEEVVDDESDVTIKSIRSGSLAICGWAWLSSLILSELSSVLMWERWWNA